MLFVRIYQFEVGIVYRRSQYLRVITEGWHWIGPFADVTRFNMARPFAPPFDLSIMRKDADLMRLLRIVEVKDSQIALHFESGNFKSVMTPGVYTVWKDVVEYGFTIVDLGTTDFISDVDPAVLSRKDLINYIRAYTVESHEEGLMFVDGKYQQALGPGTYYVWKNATPVSVTKVDLRRLPLDVTGQEILTKDKAQLRINSYAQYQVVDVIKTVVDNKDYERQLYIALQLALREYVGAMTFDELLERKETVSPIVLSAVTGVAETLGVQVSAFGIKDIILPGDVKDIMSQVLVAEKRAQANMITRREETAATRSLLNTAKLLEDNAMLFKLKEMEYVEKIADKINTITLSGGSQIVDQLKNIFSPSKSN